jgi:NAD(P)-dependent dehydrogenase (short-subunit alcohol dehydrogenase family)
MPLPKGLVIGGNSGIGEQLMFDLKHDDRFRGGVEWFVPTPVELDVRSDAAVSLYVREHGPFMFIAYCAGHNELQWISELTDAALYNTFEVNVLGFISLLHHHERRFPTAHGSAVAISSDASRIPMRTSIAYCSSKAALNMAVKCAARELAPRWRINAVAPGIINDTPMTDYIDNAVPTIRGWTAAEARKYEQSMIPLGRRGEKEEISHVMRDVLAGPSYLTGSIIEISGGK